MRASDTKHRASSHSVDITPSRGVRDVARRNRVTAFPPGFFSGRERAHRMHSQGRVMRDDDEHDPKKPRPVTVPKKGTSSLEDAEVAPWRHLKDPDRDQHRQV